MLRPASRAEAVRVERDADDPRVAVVTLDAPATRNALTTASWIRLARVVEDLGADAAVSAIVLTGAGRHFCSGADITDLPADPAEFDRVFTAAEAAVAAVPQPVIAAVDGYCVGGGAALAVAADLCLADPSARFGITANRLGVVYPPVPTRRLVERVGRSAAARLLIVGDLLDADWAKEVGLVTSIVAPRTAPDRARLMAHRLATRSQPSIRAATSLLRGGVATTHDPAAVRDYTEGVAAYREKRRPLFPSVLSPTR